MKLAKKIMIYKWFLKEMSNQRLLVEKRTVTISLKRRRKKRSQSILGLTSLNDN